MFCTSAMTMRRLLILCALFASIGSGAYAQDLWRDPTGSYTVALPSDWSREAVVNQHEVLSLKRRTETENFGCVISQQPLPTSISQAEANARIGKTTRETLQATSTSSAIEEFAVSEIGGVTTMRSLYRPYNAPIVGITIGFLLVRNGNATNNTLTCFARSQPTAAERLAIDAWLDTLKIAQ